MLMRLELRDDEDKILGSWNLNDGATDPDGGLWYYHANPDDLLRDIWRGVDVRTGLMVSHGFQKDGTVPNPVKIQYGGLDHAGCDPSAHDRTPCCEDEYGGEGNDVAADGLLGCIDCHEPLYYCKNDNTYHHVDPTHSCWLHG